MPGLDALDALNEKTICHLLRKDQNAIAKGVKTSMG